MALAQGNTVAAIHGYSDGSLRWVIIDSGFVSDSSPGGTMPPSRTESIEGLFLRMENTPVQHLLPVSEFHNEDDKSSTTCLEGLVVIGGDGSIKVISYLKRNDGTFSDCLNDNTITTCGNHAIVESLTYRIRTPILSPCVVSGCLLCVSNRSTILRPLNKPALSSTSNTCTPSIQMPLAQNIVSLEALGRQSNKFFALASTGLFTKSPCLSKNTLALGRLKMLGQETFKEVELVKMRIRRQE